MLQRKQTLFMVLALTFALFLYSFPLIGIQKDTIYLIMGNGSLKSTVKVSDTPILISYIPYLIGVLIGVIGCAIALFKKPTFQILLNRLSISLWLGLITLVLTQTSALQEALGTSELVLQLATPLPFIAILAHVFAIRGIQHDINLIKSQDRIR
jgi:hypothetical protein